MYQIFTHHTFNCILSTNEERYLRMCVRQWAEIQIYIADKILNRLCLERSCHSNNLNMNLIWYWLLYLPYLPVSFSLSDHLWKKENLNKTFSNQQKKKLKVFEGEHSEHLSASTKNLHLAVSGIAILMKWNYVILSGSWKAKGFHQTQPEDVGESTQVFMVTSWLLVNH